MAAALIVSAQNGHTFASAVGLSCPFAVFVACSNRRHDLVAILPQELPCPDAAFRGGVERVADELVDTGVAQFVEPLGNQLFLTD
jgi:hypothetical protein